MPVEGHTKSALSYLTVLSAAGDKPHMVWTLHLLPRLATHHGGSEYFIVTLSSVKMTLISLIYFFGYWFKWWWTVDKARKY